MLGKNNVEGRTKLEDLYYISMELKAQMTCNNRIKDYNSNLAGIVWH